MTGNDLATVNDLTDHGKLISHGQSDRVRHSGRDKVFVGEFSLAGPTLNTSETAEFAEWLEPCSHLHLQSVLQFAGDCPALYIIIYIVYM